MKLTDIQAKTILNSREQPTVQIVMTTAHGVFEASAPSGKSTGAHEAAVIDPHTAEGKLSTIKEQLMVHECETMSEFDALLKKIDGTENKSNLGANLILPLSMAWARGQAVKQRIPLYEFFKKELESRGVVCILHIPHPIFNVINGGAHTVVRALDFQEFQVIPTTQDFALGFSVGCEYYRKLGALLEKKFGKENKKLGDEAGYSCPFKSNQEALDSMAELIESQKYPLRIGLDSAATQFYIQKENVYLIGEKKLSAQELMGEYKKLVHAYEMVSIEDPFYEEDFNNFARLTDNVSQSARVITDDLTTTNPIRLQIAIDKKAGNTILVKPNQIGTVSETLDVIAQAHKAGWRTIVSHRSGETMDDFIADFAVGAGTWGIKAGAPGAPERLIKYQRVLEIVQSKK